MLLYNNKDIGKHNPHKYLLNWENERINIQFNFFKVDIPSHPILASPPIWTLPPLPPRNMKKNPTSLKKSPHSLWELLWYPKCHDYIFGINLYYLKINSKILKDFYWKVARFPATKDRETSFHAVKFFYILSWTMLNTKQTYKFLFHWIDPFDSVIWYYVLLSSLMISWNVILTHISVINHWFIHTTFLHIHILLNIVRIVWIKEVVCHLWWFFGSWCLKYRSSRSHCLKGSPFLVWFCAFGFWSPGTWF